MTVDEIISACRLVKAAGTSSKVPVPIAALEKLCADAKAWAAAPDYVKDAARAIRSET